LPQQCSNLDRGERRIRLAAFPLFRVVTQEVGVADLNLEHLGEASIINVGVSVSRGRIGSHLGAGWT
jgi:hypothetical protein